LRLRQLLHRVTAAPIADEAAEAVRDWLGVSHAHEAEAEVEIEIEDDEPGPRARPSRLPDGAFDPIGLLRQAVQHDANLAQVTDEGIYELIEWPLEIARRRSVLKRLLHTAQPQVVALVADELAQRGSGGFGSLVVHRELTLEQLHALAGL